MAIFNCYRSRCFPLGPVETKNGAKKTVNVTLKFTIWHGVTNK